MQHVQRSLPFGLCRKPQAGSVPIMPVAGRLCVVTGANTGIGRVIATELAARGAHVVLACRSRERTAPVVADIRRATRNERVDFRELDLARLASVRAFAADLVRDCGDVAVLCNNAGLMAPSWSATEDGFETTWQVNALAPWLLSQLLLPSLARAASQGGGARVVNVGSRLEKTGDARDLTAQADPRRRFAAAGKGEFNTFKQYGTSKLALSALTFELARRATTQAPGVVVSLCTPGIVNTDLSRFAPAWLRALSAPLRWALLRTPAAGADTPVWLASSDEPEVVVAHGGYFYDRKRIEASGAARDPSVAAALWDTCEAHAAARTN